MSLNQVDALLAKRKGFAAGLVRAGKLNATIVDQRPQVLREEVERYLRDGGTAAIVRKPKTSRTQAATPVDHAAAIARLRLPPRTSDVRTPGHAAGA